MNKVNLPTEERQKLSKDALFALFQTPFCIVQKKDSLDIYKGYLENHDLISDLPPLTHIGANYISMLPFCQIKERGFETHDDGEKILTLRITESISADLEHFKSVIPEAVLELDGEIQSNLTDKEFESTIEKVIENEIKNGEGSNFLMSRKFFGKIKDFKFETTLSILRRLIENEVGSYWNFIFYSGEDIFVGASPERHISINGPSAVMNPISGTLPKSVENFKEKLEEFILDPKEINELFQVLDEELKVICKLCPQGGKVVGPFLKEMGTLIHTEYLLEGEGKTDIRRALKESLYAATMVGSPLQNASRIVKKYEGLSRRYYSSVICLFGKDENGQEYLDNTITIRTIEIKKTGDFVIQSGNSIVRDSIPEVETKELKAKAQGLINAMLNKKKVEFNRMEFDESVLDKLVSRNEFLSKFWLKIYDKEHVHKKNITIDLIDNEDDFIYMIDHMLKYMGYTTNVYKYFDYKYNPEVDMVIIGPGPGDPSNINHDKMARLYKIADELFSNNVKILGVCLGHQIISRSLGYELMRAKIPFQGLQKEIDLFGNLQNVGFYNSYFALDNEKLNSDLKLKVSKNDDGKIYALRGENFTSYQFHFESVLTQNGLEILDEAVNYLLS